jgi:hypothetical protein
VIGLLLEEPFLNQLIDGFAEGRTADPHLLCDLDLTHPLTRHEFSGHDRPAELMHDRVPASLIGNRPGAA